jgi:hypothetical protein
MHNHIIQIAYNLGPLYTLSPAQTMHVSTFFCIVLSCAGTERPAQTMHVSTFFCTVLSCAGTERPIQGSYQIEILT